MINRCGTTKEMIVQEIEDEGTIKLIAIDRKGLYVTTIDRVDKKLADVNRYGVLREKTNQRLIQLGIDPHQLFEENRHLIQTDADGKSGEKILNPLKASKRGARG